MHTHKILSLILCFLLIFNGVFLSYTPKAQAIYPVSASIANLLPEGATTVTTGGELALNVSSKVATILTQVSVTAMKILALMAVQTATALLIGNSGEDTIIRDFNQYLYTTPQQKALTQMTSFFNTVSKGRLSTLNYEGVGPNYDAYLVAQARQAIAGQTFVTNLQDQVTDPSQLFSGNNMKGINAMISGNPANNVAGYTLVSTAQYKTDLAKAQAIAKAENVNGFTPKKKNGRIVSPAALLQSALTQVDQVGTQLIMNTDANNLAGYTQIATGTTIAITARAANYYLADSAGKQAIADKNSEFPFSLSYSSNSGVGLTSTSTGTTSSTGIGSWNKNGTITVGNTTVNGSVQINSNGTAGTSVTGTKTGTNQ